jgi:hypothetical protein
MRNLTGYLKKTLLRFNILSLFTSILLSFLFLSIFYSLKLSADNTSGGFNITADFEHTLREENIETKAIMQITSEAPRVISYYTATIPLENLRVTCFNFKTNEELECNTFNRGLNTEILINLNNSVVRPEMPLEVLILYNSSSSEKSSFTLSSSVHDVPTNSVLVTYPKSIGEPLWSSDPIQNIRSVGEDLLVLVEKPQNPKVTILFGEKLLYRFDINKVFSNTLNDQNQTFELYVPSDTPTQTVIWEEISPSPNTSLKDEDGNYIFKYIVEPNKTLDCNISGYILKTESLEFNSNPQSFLTHKSGYWSITNNTEFRRVNTYLNRKGLAVENDFDDVETLEKSEKELFYKYLYQYVLERLNYNEEIPLGIGTHTRLGAQTLTEAPNNASSVDYADFHIALLRKYNVPSRLVVGYISNITGYTSDGFYHHWIEYLDTNQNRWITADPFLEAYFKKSLFGTPFLDHIAIVRRGKSAVAPKISFFQETDFVVRAETEEKIIAKLDVSAEFVIENYKITDQYAKGFVNISNSGNIAVNSIEITSSNISEIPKYMDPVNNLQSQIILPKQNGSIQFNIPYSEIDYEKLFVSISFANLDRYKIDDTLQTDIEENVPTFLSILSKVLSILIFSIFLFLIYFLLSFIKRKVLKIKKKSKNG